MAFRLVALAVAAHALCAPNSFGQTTFVESEPNSQKPEATRVTGLVTGDSITGATVGTTTTLGDTSAASVDLFRVQTGVLPLGIYKHTLALTSSTAGHAGSIRGRTQQAGVPTTNDAEFQLSSTAGTPANANVWFGFGKGEEIYYRVVGDSSTTANYSATLATTPVVPTIVGSPITAGPITITTVGQTAQDTEIYVYDQNFDPIAGCHNDDEGPGGSTFQSRLTRTFAPGTYYVIVSSFDVANDRGDANADEDFLGGYVLDFPNALCSSTRPAAPPDYDVAIIDSMGTTPVTLLGGLEYDIVFARITVVPGAPPANDACANAIPITSSAQGLLGGATNDGGASCDTGGAASRDLWYSFTAGPFGGTISPATCAGGAETVLTVFLSCGGAELGCNDDCGGSPCGAPGSCLAGIALGANQEVRLRVSDKSSGTGLFTLDVNYVGNAPGHDDCSTPLVLGGPGVYPFDTTLATTGTQGQAATTGCGSSVKKDLWFTLAATTNGTLTVSTCGQVTGGNSQDTKIAIYAGSGCPTGAGLACNDDSACALNGLNSIVSTNVTCGQWLTLQVGGFDTTSNLSGTFTVSEAGSSVCGTPATSICAGSAVGTTCLACGNNGGAGRGCANSGNAAGARLSSTGFASIGADTLVLTASDITGPGLFFQSNGTLALPMTFGDGMLCAAVGIVRLGVVFPTSGSAAFPGGGTPNPIHVAGAPISPGEFRHYQCWYRDATAFCTASTFNLTQGLSLAWGS